MTIASGATDISAAARRRLVRGGPQGSPFEPWSYPRLFPGYGQGTIFDTSWSVREIQRLIETDGVSRKNEAVLTLPIRSAPWEIRDAPGDRGEGDFCREVMSQLMSGLIDRCSNGFTTRKAFHELVWGLDDGRAVLTDVAWRPAATCDQAWSQQGAPDGFWQQMPPDLSSPGVTSTSWPGWKKIEQARSFVYVHGRHREPIRGVSDLDVSLHLYEQRRKLTFLLYQFLELQSTPRVIARGTSQQAADDRADGLFEAKAGGIVPVAAGADEQSLYQVVESSGRGVEQFLTTIKWLEGQQTHSILAGFTDLADAAASGKGSYALSENASSFFLQNRQAVADELAAQITDGVLKPLAVLNFGVDAAVPSLNIGPISSDEINRAFDLLKTLIVSPQVNAPDDFIDQLIISTAQYIGQDADEIRGMVENHRAEREAKQAAARLESKAPTASQDGQQPPIPGLEDPAAGADEQVTALSHAIDLSHELVSRVRGGQDARDAMLELSQQPGPDSLALTRHVRTEAGVSHYHLPIGSPLGSGHKGNPLAEAAEHAKSSGASRFVQRHDDGSVSVHDAAPDGAHYRVSPAGSLLHVDGQGRTRPVPATARPAVERSLSGDQDTKAAEDFPSVSTEVEHDVIEHADYLGSPDEKKALRRYTGNGYRMINGLLRGHLETDMERDRARGMVADLENVFDQHPPLHRNVTVLRGLTDAGWMPSRDLSGEKIVNKGFVSTSFDADTAESFGGDAMFEIQIPKGFKALPAAGVFGEDEQQEHELVLPHGTIFSVVSDEKRDVNGAEVRWLTVSAEPPTVHTAKVP